MILRIGLEDLSEIKLVFRDYEIFFSLRALKTKTNKKMGRFQINLLLRRIMLSLLHIKSFSKLIILGFNMT